MNKKQTTPKASVMADEKTEKPTSPSTLEKPLIETKPKPKEIGGPKGPEPTRYGDWEQKGRCSDF